MFFDKRKTMNKEINSSSNTRSELMDQESSLVMIKPDGVARGLTNQIIQRFIDAGLKITVKKELIASQEIVTKHYPLDNRDYVLGLGHRDLTGLSPVELTAIYDKNFKIIKALHQYIQSGPVLAMIIAGPIGTVQKIRDIVGKTNPAEAAPGTIRGDFGEDSYAKSDAEGRSVRNLMHASGSVEEAEAEIKIWFPELS